MRPRRPWVGAARPTDLMVGAVTLEYVLVATLIAVVAAVGVRALGLSVTALLDTAIALF